MFFSYVKLQLTVKKSTGERICSLLNVSIPTTMETSQKSHKLRIRIADCGIFAFSTQQGHFRSVFETKHFLSQPF